MDARIKPVKPGERIQYHCVMCGECCRHVKDQVMLEPLDAYHLGRLLKQESALETMDEVYARFTHPIMLDDGFPIFAMNTVGDSESCVFLRNGRCSVYEARLRVCRLYPLTVDTGSRGRRFQYYSCMDDHRAHFKGGTMDIKDWTYQNFTKEDRQYLEREAQVLPEIGGLLKRMSKEQRMDELFHLLFYRYYNYSLRNPFMEQYEQNQTLLLERLRNCAEKEAV